MASRRLWEQILHELATRNEAVELTPLSETTDEPGDEAASSRARSYRSRVLAAGKDGSLLVELPTAPQDAASALKAAPAVEVVVTRAGQRWAGECPALGPIRHQLNGQTTVIALRLGEAVQVRSAQRREFYRVTTSGLRMDPLWLRPQVAFDDPKQSLPLARAHLVNLSGSGLGVRLEHPELTANTVQHGQMFRCRFQLPGEPDPVTVSARVVQIEPAEQQMVYLGMELVFADDAEQRRVQDQLVRFATEVERHRLRRQRRA